MEIDTKDYGRIVIDMRQVITFTRGMYGFEDLKKWALIDTDKKPFYILQNLEKKDIAFILINPYLVCTDYTLDISENDFDAIDNPESNNLLVFAIITVKEEEVGLTVNLAGPLLINRHECLGIQTIQQDLRWSTRHALSKE